MSDYNNNSNANRTRDPLVLVKSMGYGANNSQKFLSEHARHRLQLRIVPDEAKRLIEALTKIVETNDRAKLDVYWGKKATKDGSRIFDSAFFYVKTVQEEGAANAGAPTEFVDAETTKSLS